MEIKGKVYAVLPLQSGTSAKGDWKRQVVVVEYRDGQYTSKVALENTNKADAFGKLNVGDEGTFKCNTPTSREYNGRWYTSVMCWSWDINSGGEQEQASAPSTTTSATVEQATDADGGATTVDAPF